MIGYEDVKLCNCAECRRTMIGMSMVGFALPSAFDHTPKCGGHISGRPYCDDCLKKRRVPLGRICGKDDNPSFDNVMRALEEDR